uniref:DDE-domain-containing protein n=1 Tax=Mycena chlorophos TaxID=658473 RepID=A0ABQ0LT11_MYCCL|nr:DDE-domain-containing protein [Mycena chlorophos]
MPPKSAEEIRAQFPDDEALANISQEDRVVLAVHAHQALGVPIRRAAIWLQVSRSTVQRRIDGTTSRKEAHEHQKKVATAMELVLVGLAKELSHRAVPLTSALLNDYGSKLSGQPVGATWARRFLDRYRDQLKIKLADNLESVCASALNRPAVHEYFTILAATIEKYNIKPQNMYNMDEKGIRLGAATRIAVIVDRDQSEIRNITGPGERDMLTAVECLPAEGPAMRPMIIYQGKKCDRTWSNDNLCNAAVAASENGWTDQELGSLWMEKCFAPESAQRLASEDEYRLLILDGHNSHTTLRFIDHVRRHRIVILCLPAHTTHALQPCDVGVFGPLEAKWKQVAFQQGVVITKSNFLKYYHKAREQAFTQRTITRAFAKCGIYPLDEFAVPDHLFAPALNTTTEPTLPIRSVTPPLLVPIRAPHTPLSTPVRPAPALHTPRTPRPAADPAALTSDPEHHEAVVATLYKLALPSPVKKTASKEAIYADYQLVRDIAKEAGVELAKSRAENILAAVENGRLRTQLFAKKSRKGRRPALNTGHARVLTSDEIREAIANEAQEKEEEKAAKAMRAVLANNKKILAAAKEEEEEEARARRKEAKAAEKAAKEAAKEAAKAARLEAKEKKKAEKEAERLRKATGRDEESDHASDKDTGTSDEDIAEQSTNSIPVVVRPHPRPRPLRPQCTQQQDHLVQVQEESGDNTPLLPGAEVNEAASDDKDLAPPGSDWETSGDETDDDEGDKAGTTVDRADGAGEENDDEDQRVLAMLESGEMHLDLDEDEELDGDETTIVSLNGHRWFQRVELQLQVLWDDGDCTWEPLSNLSECTALDEYLRRLDVEDPLDLPRRKNIFDKKVQASNE